MGRQKRHQSRHCPHTYITIGQDYTSIQDYIRNVVVVGRHTNNTTYEYDDDSDIATDYANDDSDVTTGATTASKTVDIPSIYMFYTDLQELRGLYEPIDYGGGVQYANGLLQQQQFPLSLQIGLWLNGTVGCQNILHGRLQAQIQALFHYCIVATTTGVSKIYLRIGYEFDNPQFGYSDAPNIYQQAFRYIIQECYTLYSYGACRSKIDFVWHSWAASLLPFDEASSFAVSEASTITILDDYYPGDDYVDWVGISIFSQLYTDTTIPKHIVPLGNMRTVQNVCSFAQQHHKPIMIAESTPFGGIDQLRDPWQDWFLPILHLIDTYNIQMWSYIYCNWNSIPMWNNTGFGDSRIDQNRTVLKLWYQHVLDNPRFHSRDDSNDINRIDHGRSNFMIKKEPPGSISWKNYDALQGSLSSTIELKTDGQSQSIALVSVVLFLAVTISQWHVRRGNTKRRGYEMVQ